jgi:hypothetical protein
LKYGFIIAPGMDCRVGRTARTTATGGRSMESSHLSALEFKHAGIERQLHEELSRPMPDDALVQDLKKRKLRIKEQLLRH